MSFLVSLRHLHCWPPLKDVIILLVGKMAPALSVDEATIVTITALVDEIMAHGQAWGVE